MEFTDSAIFCDDCKAELEIDESNEIDYDFKEHDGYEYDYAHCPICKKKYELRVYFSVSIVNVEREE